MFKLLQKRDDQLAAAFNDFRRSTAVHQLAIIQSHELLTAEEMSRFTPEIRGIGGIRSALETFRPAN